MKRYIIKRILAKKHIKKSIVLLAVALIFTSNNLIAQHLSDDQISLLQKYSIEKADEWKNQRSEAEKYAAKVNIPINGTTNDSLYFELQYIENGIPKYYITDNLNSAKTISTNNVWPGTAGNYNLDGSNIVLGEWDGGGVLTTHSEFNNTGTSRAIQMDNPNATNYHATHVAGTMIAGGVNPNAKGMSFSATLNAYDWNLDESEMANAASLGLKVSNHSYGYITGWRSNYWYGDINISSDEDNQFGLYTNSAQEWDNIAHMAPHYLIVRSAGNDRNDYLSGNLYYVYVNGTWEQRDATVIAAPLPDGGVNQLTDGFDTIGGEKTAKNILTVGAVNDIVGGYSQPGDVIISSFSSFGPTDDGRIKPDIVANGVSLYSAYNTNNSSYASLSGTSMSSPSVAGSIGLLLQQLRNFYPGEAFLSSTIKGLIIHTADEAGSDDGPDYKYGWGLMNTEKAANLIANDNGNNLNIHELLINNGETIELPVNVSAGTSELKVTIAWTDPAGIVHPNTLDPTNLTLVNDLDIHLVRTSDGAVFHPWVLDPYNPNIGASIGDNDRDNVEQVLIKSPASGQYSINITHEGTILGGSQEFSLIVTGNTMKKIPTNFVAGNNFDGIVPLTWDRILSTATDTVDYYKVYRAGSSGGPYTLIGNTSASVQVWNYIDNTVTNGNAYFYVVTALYKDGDESGYSSEVDAMPIANGMHIISPHSLAAPTIDGTINSSEWSDAYSMDIRHPGIAQPITLYMKNDDGHLYLALDDPNNTSALDINDLIIFFDDDNNNTWDPAAPSTEGYYILGVSNNSVYRRVLKPIHGDYPLYTIENEIANPTGFTSNYSMSSGHMQFEVRIDLSTSLLTAFPGDEIGIRISNWNQDLQSSAYYTFDTGTWPYGSVNRNPLSYGKLTIGSQNAVALLQPNDNTTHMDTEFTLYWEKDEFATGYNLQVATESSFSNLIVDENSVVDTFYQLSNLNNLSAFYWRVKGNYPTEEAIWSDVWQFQTGEEYGWVKKTSGVASWFNQIQSFADTCWIGSETILRSQNNGSYWDIKRTSAGGTSYFLNGKIGWAGSGTNEYGYPYIIKTTDNGNNWSEHQITTYFHYYEHMHFFDANNGVILDEEGRIHKTTDGGETWLYTDRIIYDAFEYSALEMFYFDIDTWWTITDFGGMLKTTTGGSIWEDQPPSNNYNGIHFSNINNGWAVGTGGDIIHTTNSGTNWQTQTSGTTNDLREVYFVDNLNGWAAGDVGTIIKTTDGGQTWTSESTITNENIYDLYFDDLNSGWAVGSNGTILKYSAQDIGCQPGWIAAQNQQYNMSVIGLIKFDDVTTLNEMDAIGAFVGSECRGIASPIGALDGKIFLTITSDQQSGETVTFKAWKSSSCEELAVLETFEFINQSEVGTLENPFEFNAGLSEHVYNFPNGYDWFSVNINPGDLGVNSVFNGLIASSNDRIIGQTSFAVYDGGSNQWVGSLLTMDPKQMYIMKLASADQFTLQGLPIDPLTNPISLNSGFSWIGYLPQSSLPINAALGSMTVSPTSNDRVIGQTSFAVYDGGSSQWVGSLINLEPGEGYKINLANSTVLTYPANSEPNKNNPQPFVKTEGAPDWTPVPNLQYNMQVIGKIMWDGVASTNTSDMIAAFVNGECRGVTNTTTFQNLFFLSIGSNVQSGEEIYFMEYHADLDEIDDSIYNFEPVIFFDQGELGSIDAPWLVESVLPVELVSFTVSADGGTSALLQWETATEINNYGFEVERKINDENAEWQNITFIEGAGNSNSPKIYSFSDNNLLGGSQFVYRLKQIDVDGTYAYSDEVEVEVIPSEYILYQNYPNPFNPSTKIRFSIVDPQRVDLRLYNAIGEKVKTLFNQNLEAGYHEVEFRADNLAGGIYFYRITTDNFVQTKKMLLLK